MKERFARPWVALTLVILALFPAAMGYAQDAELMAKITELENGIAAAQMAGDNAWMMTASALVLMMTAPGLILFYGGLVRSRNVLSIFMQCVFLMGMASVFWLVIGYSLAFSEGNAFVGGLGYLFLRDVGMEPGGPVSAIPHQTFMFFQMMFAIITPALMVGAFAERFRFKALVPFMFFWLLLIYAPLCHMVWGPGGFLNTKIPALDFAGGTVVHISSGVSALVIALMIGKRRNYPNAEYAPHSLVLSTIGAGLLWVGWFGFNAGSAVAADGRAAGAFSATHFSAAGAALSWMVAEWVVRKKPSLLGAISGIVAGLVGVTPAAGFVTPVDGLLIGLITGAVCFVAVMFLKPRLGFDDSLDVFGVHGVGGITGAVLTGVFTREAIGGTAGLLEGNPGQVVQQVLAVLVTIVLSIAVTATLTFIVDKVIGIRPTEEEEMIGLDLVDHGETGYHNLTPA
ncbi:MAG: ammonium transporter, Amt family [Candidatus Sumerlaeota bacterium]|nr:ammonium transporter, Amt family [Candidatus Sumerlaeota bacterium]